MGKKSLWPAILVILCICTQSAYACTAATFGLEWDSSIDTKNFTVNIYAPYFATNVTNCGYNWNGISSQVNVSNVYSYDANTDPYTQDISIFQKDLSGTTIGRTYFYKKGIFGWTEVGTTSSGIKLSRIALDSALLNDSDAFIEKVITHELGHAFGLCHPIEVNCTAYAVMQQSSTNYWAYTIQPHDRNNLIAKWGN